MVKKTDAQAPATDVAEESVKVPEKQSLRVGAAVAPLLSDYFVKGDDQVGFRSSFLPYKISLQAVGDNGTISLVKKSSPVVSYQDRITVVFLGIFTDKVTKRPVTACNCSMYKAGADGNKVQGDKGDNVCYSPFRIYSLGGFLCKKCPYPREDLKKGVIYRKRLTHEMFFAVRDPRDPVWYLASYVSKLDTIAALNGGIFRKIHDEMVSKHGGKVGAEAIVELRVRKQKLEGGIVVVNFDDHEIKGCLNEDSYKKMRALAEEVMTQKMAILQGYHTVGEQRYKDNQAAGAIDNIDTATPVVVEEADHAPVEEKAPETTTSTAQVVRPAANPDDDLPF